MDIARIVEFCINNWMLISTFIALLASLIVIESRRSGLVISPQQAVRFINKENAAVLDLREASEFITGHITGAINMPFVQLKAGEHQKAIEKLKGKAVILVCKMGQHSSVAGNLLKAAGVSSVYRLEGGLQSWLGEKLPLVKGK